MTSMKVSGHHSFFREREMITIRVHGSAINDTFLGSARTGRQFVRIIDGPAIRLCDLNLYRAREGASR